MCLYNYGAEQYEEGSRQDALQLKRELPQLAHYKSL